MDSSKQLKHNSSEGFQNFLKYIHDFYHTQKKPGKTIKTTEAVP